MGNKVKQVMAFAVAVLILALAMVEPGAFLKANAAESNWLWPVPGSTDMSRGYGNGHNALDITAWYGADVVAAKSGTVTLCYWGCGNTNGYYSPCTSKGTCAPNTENWHNGCCNYGYGNGIVIDHGDGTFSSYAHMATLDVGWGSVVSQGQKLGTMGSSGYSTGTHLDFWIGYDMWGYNRVNTNPGAVNYIYSVQPPLSVVKTTTCDYRLTIPANYKLVCYWNAADTTPAERWINPKDSAYRLACDQQVTLSDESVRYQFTSAEGYVLYFTYDSSLMQLEIRHSFVNVSGSLPTCTTPGETVKECSDCGHIERETAPARGHDYETVYIIDQQPSCTQPGSKSQHCTRCAAKRNETPIPATGHEWGDGVVTKQPTAQQEGVRTYTCFCGESKTEVIPVLGGGATTGVYEEEPNNSEDYATTIPLNTPVGGNISQKGSIGTTYGHDYFTFRLPEDGYISVNFKHEAIKNGGWTIYLPDELSLYSDCDETDKTSHRIGLPAGKYTVCVYSDDARCENVEYTLNVKFTASSTYEQESNNRQGDANLISLDTPIGGNISQKGSIGTVYGYDTFAFRLQEEGYVSFNFQHEMLKSGEWIIYLPDGSALYAEGDIANVSSRRIHLPAGKHYVSVCSYDTVCVGVEYLFTVQTGTQDSLGDVDGDGNITSTDARLTLQYYAGKIRQDQLNVSVADVDGDGDITSTDARLILQRYAGKIKAFPAE